MVERWVNSVCQGQGAKGFANRSDRDARAVTGEVSNQAIDLLLMSALVPTSHSGMAVVDDFGITFPTLPYPSRTRG